MDSLMDSKFQTCFRLAAAASLPGAVALELAAGLSWADRGLGRQPTPPAFDPGISRDTVLQTPG